MLQKGEAPTGFQEYRVPNQLAVDTTAHHSHGLVEFCSCTTDVQDTLLISSGASTLSRSDLLSLSLVVSLGSQETTSGTANTADLLTILRDFDFDAHLFNI